MSMLHLVLFVFTPLQYEVSCGPLDYPEKQGKGS
jgi:hypothetical protein